MAEEVLKHKTDTGATKVILDLSFIAVETKVVKSCTIFVLKLLNQF